MRKITLFFLFFLFFVLSGLAGAEKKYLNIGADPVESGICKKRNLQIFKLEKDAYVATTAKSRKVSVGWIPAGTEIGILSFDENVICVCGNSVKILHYEEVKTEPKIEPKPESVPPVISETPEKKKKKIIIITRIPEPVYVPVPVERPSASYFIDYSWRGWGYGGGYVTRGRVIHRDYRRNNYHRDRYRPSHPRAYTYSRGGPGPDPPN